MLLEVLVAIAVAGLMLGVIGRVFAQAWSATRAPLDVVSAVTLARVALEPRPDDDALQASMPRGFAVTRHVEPVVLAVRPNDLAPAPQAQSPPPGAIGRGPAANDVMPGVTHHPPPGGGTGRLQRITVAVRTPTGRRVTLQTLRLDVAPR